MFYDSNGVSCSAAVRAFARCDTLEYDSKHIPQFSQNPHLCSKSVFTFISIAA